MVLHFLKFLLTIQPTIVSSKKVSFLLLLQHVLRGCQEMLSGMKVASQVDINSTPEIISRTHPNVKRGIEKQYDIMRRWVDDPDHALGQ
jgi:hypothetical protein